MTGYQTNVGDFEMEVDVSGVSESYWIRYHFYYTTNNSIAEPEAHLVVSSDPNGSVSDPQAGSITDHGFGIRNDSVSHPTGSDPVSRLESVQLIPE